MMRQRNPVDSGGLCCSGTHNDYPSRRCSLERYFFRLLSWISGKNQCEPTTYLINLRFPRHLHLTSDPFEFPLINSSVKVRRLEGCSRVFETTPVHAQDSIWIGEHFVSEPSQTRGPAKISPPFLDNAIPRCIDNPPARRYAVLTNSIIPS